MALWKVNGEIVFAPGALSLPGDIAPAFVSRYVYNVPYTNVGKGGFMMKDGKKIHTPTWMEVHPETTLDDIVVDKKPFEELFVEPKSWKFKSASSDIFDINIILLLLFFFFCHFSQTTGISPGWG